MSQDFVTRLELQLSEAERRMERGSRLSRLVASARVWRPSRATVVGLAATAMLLVAVVAGVVALTRGGERKVAQPGPRVVGRLHTGTNYAMTVGFGAIWANALDDERVLRIDPVRHRIVARIPVGRLPTGVATAAGSVWVVAAPRSDSYVVSRIDPASNRVAARIPLTAQATALIGPDGLPRLRSNGEVLWVLGGHGGVRIDPVRGAIAAVVPWGLGAGANAGDGALTGNDLWIHGADGRLLLLDARTGARRATLSSPQGPVRLVAIPGPAVIVADGSSVTRIDAATGRARWTVRLQHGAPVTTEPASAPAVAGNTVWALSENQQQVTERLTEIDLASGRVRGSVALKDVGAGGLTAVGRELWYAAGPDTVSLSP
jgi:DNA-binding beta-propeller fold protein YncE